MEVLTRKQFIDIMCREFSTDKLTASHPIWTPEKYSHSPPIRCTTFLNTKPVNTTGDFWLWCNEALAGQVRCFSSGDTDEYWGFTDPADVTIWTLRWAT